MLGWFFTSVSERLREMVHDILSNLGLYNKTAKILFLGLDNAGKTTLLRRMKDNVVGIYEPTFHPNYDNLIVGNIHFHTFDLGGHESSRNLWRNYWEDIDGIVFLVDAVDSQRFDEAKKELHIILKEKKIDKTPILILGNKIDCPQAVSKKDLRNRLSFSQTKKVELFMCSVIKNFGYQEGFEWLGKII